MSDRGAGTALAAVVLLGLCLTMALGLMALGWMSTRRDAGQVADLAALAGAHAVARGEAGCTRASEVARRNQAELKACRTEGAPPSFVVVVTVSMALRPQVAGAPTRVEVTSWAGPGEPAG